jgi:hypothetical protein
MKSNISRITSGAFAVGMLVGVSACVQLFDHSPDVKVRPVANMQGDRVAPDSEYYLSAVSAINSRDYATALEYLQAARAKEPENIRVLNAFGVVYDKLGRFDLSARYYAQAGALDPKSIIIAKNIAYSKALQGISAPDVSQLASSETPPTATVRMAGAQTVPVSRVLAPAAPSTSLLSAPASVIARAQSTASDVPARSSATTIATVPSKQVATIVSASLSSPRPVAPNVATIVKVWSPVAALPTHFSAPPAVIDKIAAASAKADVSDTRISPAAASRVTVIAKSSAPDLSARSAMTVAVARLKLAVSIAPASLSLPRSAPSVATSIVKKAVLAPFTSARPAYPSAAQAVAIKATGSPKADASKRVLLTGYPLVVTDASGATDTVQSVRHNLAMLGWTISRAAAPNIRSQHDSIVFYPPANIAAAHALARTLPFPVRMTVNQCHCGGLQLMIGSDVQSWRNAHRYNPNLRPKTLSVAAISNTTRMGVQ